MIITGNILATDENIITLTLILSDSTLYDYLFKAKVINYQLFRYKVNANQGSVLAMYQQGIGERS